MVAQEIQINWELAELLEALRHPVLRVAVQEIRRKCSIVVYSRQELAAKRNLLLQRMKRHVHQIPQFKITKLLRLGIL